MASSVLMLLVISAALFVVVIGQPDFCNKNGDGWKAAQTFTGTAGSSLESSASSSDSKTATVSAGQLFN